LTYFHNVHGAQVSAPGPSWPTCYYFVQFLIMFKDLYFVLPYLLLLVIMFMLIWAPFENKNYKKWNWHDYNYTPAGESFGITVSVSWSSFGSSVGVVAFSYIPLARLWLPILGHLKNIINLFEVPFVKLLFQRIEMILPNTIGQFICLKLALSNNFESPGICLTFVLHIYLWIKVWTVEISWFKVRVTRSEYMVVNYC
jgi:hypothetical protein